MQLEEQLQQNKELVDGRQQAELEDVKVRTTHSGAVEHRPASFSDHHRVWCNPAGHCISLVDVCVCAPCQRRHVMLSNEVEQLSGRNDITERTLKEHVNAKRRCAKCKASIYNKELVTPVAKSTTAKAAGSSSSK